MTATDCSTARPGRRRAPATASGARPTGPVPGLGGSSGTPRLVARRGRRCCCRSSGWCVASLKRNNEVFTDPDPVAARARRVAELPRHLAASPTWRRGCGNTLLLSVVVTFLQVLTGSFAAYGFAKVRFPGRDAAVPGLRRHHRGAVAVVHDPAVHPDVEAAAVEHAVVDHPAAGVRRVRRVPDEAVLRDDPRGALRGGPDRRAQRVRHLAADHAAAVRCRRSPAWPC